MYSKVFMESYKSFENYLCQSGLQEGKLLPLKQNGEVVVLFQSATEDDSIIIPQKHTSTIISWREIFPTNIPQKLATLWPDFPISELMFSYHGGELPNPFPRGNGTTPKRIMDELKAKENAEKAAEKAPLPNNFLQVEARLSSLDCCANANFTVTDKSS